MPTTAQFYVSRQQSRVIRRGLYRPPIIYRRNRLVVATALTTGTTVLPSVGALTIQGQSGTTFLISIRLTPQTGTLRIVGGLATSQQLSNTQVMRLRPRAWFYYAPHMFGRGQLRRVVRSRVLPFNPVSRSTVTPATALLTLQGGTGTGLSTPAQVIVTPYRATLSIYGQRPTVTPDTALPTTQQVMQGIAARRKARMHSFAKQYQRPYITGTSAYVTVLKPPAARVVQVTGRTLTITGGTPTIRPGRTVAPSRGTLSIQGQSGATVTLGTVLGGVYTVLPQTGTLLIAADVPLVNGIKTLPVSTGATLSVQGGAVAALALTRPQTATLSIQAGVPSLSGIIVKTIDPNSGLVRIIGNQLLLSGVHTTVTPDSGLLSIAGNSSDIVALGHWDETAGAASSWTTTAGAASSWEATAGAAASWS